jgi:hypothetical protein
VQETLAALGASLAGRRKPMVIGPNSIAVIVDGEGRTLGNAVRDAAWLQ